MHPANQSARGYCNTSLYQLGEEYYDFALIRGNENYTNFKKSGGTFTMSESYISLSPLARPDCLLSNNHSLFPRLEASNIPHIP